MSANSSAPFSQSSNFSLVSSAPRSVEPVQHNGFCSAGPLGSAKQQLPITLIDIHGVLMAIAWLGLIPAAIFSARYLRSSWPEKSLFGLKLWFHIHRSLNFVAVMLIVVSAGLAFYARGQWTGPWFGRHAAENSCAGAWHSLFGLFAILLAVRQPLNALLRCAADHPRRPLFNWMHRIAGLVAYVLAMVPLFIGVFVRRILHRKISEWLLIGFHIVLLLIVIGAELVGWLEKRKKHPFLVENDGDSESSGYEQEGAGEPQPWHSTVRHLLFGLLLISSATCSGLLTAFILSHD